MSEMNADKLADALRRLLGAKWCTPEYETARSTAAAILAEHDAQPAQAAQPVGVADGGRDAFEAWSRERGYNTDKDESGYRSGVARLAWAAWRSAVGAGFSIPAGYRLQPICEFDAYQCVLRETTELRKALRLAREYMSEAVDYGTPCAKRDAELVDEVLSDNCTVTPQPPAQPSADAEDWTDQQCIEFMSVGLRHVRYAKVKGAGPTCDEIRQGVRAATAARSGG